MFQINVCFFCMTLLQLKRLRFFFINLIVLGIIKAIVYYLFEYWIQQIYYHQSFFHFTSFSWIKIKLFYNGWVGWVNYLAQFGWIKWWCRPTMKWSNQLDHYPSYRLPFYEDSRKNFYNKIQNGNNDWSLYTKLF